MKFVAVTSCPTGIAHTYMAAEALEQAAADAGDEIHVETQGSAGSDPLDQSIIDEADAVIFAADVDVRGREVAQLVDRDLPAGRHSAEWTVAGNIAAGVYFLHLTAPGIDRVQRCVLLP